MARTFVFYDLETSGLNPAEDRIMQFAAIRTDLELEPIGEPYNFLIKLSDDVLPSPSAIKVTGITPQKTVEEGYTEAEATRLIFEDIFTPDTIVVGYNNVRFDDNFIRFLFWRNYRDAYEWSYKDGRSRWDLLDVVRMFRAIQPAGINWPLDEKGKATNRLELLSKLNGLNHVSAHDALSDVEALIGVAKLLKSKSLKLWEWLLKNRDKNEVKNLVNLNDRRPFIYSSGRLETEFEKTTLAYPICSSKNSNIIIYNLRYDPSIFISSTPAKMAKIISAKKVNTSEKSGSEILANDGVEAEEIRRKVYFKEFKYNQCPAVAPLEMLSSDDYLRLGLNKDLIDGYIDTLENHPEIKESIQKLYELKSTKREEEFNKLPKLPEAMLYDGFIQDNDRTKMSDLAKLGAEGLKVFQPSFKDDRLNGLYLGYKARSFPGSLTESEVIEWESARSQKLANRIDNYITELTQLSQSVDEGDKFLAEELKLWLESIQPSDF